MPAPMMRCLTDSISWFLTAFAIGAKFPEIRGSGAALSAKVRLRHARGAIDLERRELIDGALESDTQSSRADPGRERAHVGCDRAGDHPEVAESSVSRSAA